MLSRGEFLDELEKKFQHVYELCEEGWNSADVRYDLAILIGWIQAGNAVGWAQDAFALECAAEHSIDECEKGVESEYYDKFIELLNKQ